MMEHLRKVFNLVAQMDTLGYTDPALMPQRSAKALFDAVRAVRLACGQKAHDLLVEEARKAAAAQQLPTGGGGGGGGRLE
ncbi:hypothetical protein DQ04_11931000 [Trypanosoma grayi]|uniref:hypothetical protein n=1 Tax=Trypanosoma grayi TaxID=71804 RepID=UPI0004F4225D|nr:hypothetical protein DQ04_11931000 [Trypanosoma grayi]KEG06849.1 hypothetical protein DQ04_11931000 [Trypanosoma grayi]